MSPRTPVFGTTEGHSFIHSIQRIDSLFVRHVSRSVHSPQIHLCSLHDILVMMKVILNFLKLRVYSSNFEFLSKIERSIPVPVPKNGGAKQCTHLYDVVVVSYRYQPVASAVSLNLCHPNNQGVCCSSRCTFSGSQMSFRQLIPCVPPSISNQY